MKVAPTAHSVVVEPAKPGPKVEPIARELIATLTHPDRKATVRTVKFSGDGKRLFTAGYPSGIVQVFDVESRKELRRIDTHAGPRGSANLSPDWKTLYVPIMNRAVKAIEKDGKRLHRIEYSGSIRVWSLMSGEERAPFKPAEDHASQGAILSPNGSILVTAEVPSYDTDSRMPPVMTMAWDLKSGTKRTLAEGYAFPVFSPNGKTFATQTNDVRAKTTAVEIHDKATFRELAKLDCPEKDRQFSLEGFSPDGSVIAIGLGGKKGAPREVWFRDAKTLEDRGQFLGEASHQAGWGAGQFTPDGKHYIIMGRGTASVWVVAERKVTRTFEIGNDSWQIDVSPDSKTLAIAWVPKLDPELASARNPDPQDQPQPRITLFDLAGTKPPRTLIAPHGGASVLAFSPDGQTLALGTTGGVRIFDLTK